MKKLIIEFINYVKHIDEYQKIELTELEKEKLEAFDTKVLYSLRNKVLEHLSKKMLKGETSPEYILWAKFTLDNFIKYFNNNK